MGSVMKASETLATMQILVLFLCSSYFPRATQIFLNKNGADHNDLYPAKSSISLVNLVFFGSAPKGNSTKFIHSDEIAKL